MFSLVYNWNGMIMQDREGERERGDDDAYSGDGRRAGQLGRWCNCVSRAFRNRPSLERDPCCGWPWATKKLDPPQRRLGSAANATEPESFVPGVLLACNWFRSASNNRAQRTKQTTAQQPTTAAQEPSLLEVTSLVQMR